VLKAQYFERGWNGKFEPDWKGKFKISSFDHEAALRAYSASNLEFSRSLKVELFEQAFIMEGWCT